MNRRHFMLGTAVFTVAGATLPIIAQAQNQISQAPTSSTRRFTFKQTYNLKPPDGSSGEAKLWIPLPEDAAPFQKIISLRFDGNYQEAFITADNDYHAKTLFAKWPSSNKPMTLEVEIVVQTTDWEPMKDGLLQDYQAPANPQYPADVQRYLAGTSHVPTDGVVQEYVQKIIGNETNPLKKAHLIYEWTAQNMERDNSVIGCGLGDVSVTLSTGKLSGKCTDISSVFVALARAAGIPAREMFGIRLGRAGILDQYSKTAFGSANENGLANVTTWQHCRAQFYLAGFGWVPCDPADVAKMRLTENKTHDDAAVQAVNTYLFGNWDMNWVGFNYGRDFHLSPTAEQMPINNFAYPYAEVDGDPLNYYEPEEFAYDYTSQQEA